MKFIIYGNEDSPVVPILLYIPGKVMYADRHTQILYKLYVTSLQCLFPGVAEEEDCCSGGGVSSHIYRRSPCKDLSLCFTYPGNARLCMYMLYTIVLYIYFFLFVYRH